MGDERAAASSGSYPPAVNSSAPDMHESEARVVHVHVDEHTTVLEAEPGPYVRLDAEGRWTARRGTNGSFRRTLDGRIARVTAHGFEPVEAGLTRDLHEGAVGDLRALAGLCARGSEVRVEAHGDADALSARLEDCLRWQPADLAAHDEALRAAWPEPTHILPPHRYRDLVALPAIGCPNHACTFCAFYRERPFRVLDDEAFDVHLAAVVDVLGRALHERTGIFLGSASALSLRDELLLRRMERVASLLGVRPRGVAAFLDPDRGPARSTADWRRLREGGLRDVTLGLETGLASLRTEAGKSGDLRALVETVWALRESGLAVSVTVLLGMGGPEQEEEHREATLEVLAAMDLGPADTVYLSPLEEGGPRGARARELASWREATRVVSAARAVPYLVERFAWLS